MLVFLLHADIIALGFELCFDARQSFVTPHVGIDALTPAQEALGVKLGGSTSVYKHRLPDELQHTKAFSRRTEENEMIRLLLSCGPHVSKDPHKHADGSNNSPASGSFGIFHM